MNQEINIEELKGKSKEEIKNYLTGRGISSDVAEKISKRLFIFDKFKLFYIAFFVVMAFLPIIMAIFYSGGVIRGGGVGMLSYSVYFLVGFGIPLWWSYFIFKKILHKNIQQTIGRESGFSVYVKTPLKFTAIYAVGLIFGVIFVILVIWLLFSLAWY